MNYRMMGFFEEEFRNMVQALEFVAEELLSNRDIVMQEIKQDF